MQVKLLLALALSGLAVLFIVQNVAVVEIQFLFWSLSLSMSRSLLMFLLLAIAQLYEASRKEVRH